MVIASLAWSLKAWLALSLPIAPRWGEKHTAERERILRMDFRSFVQRVMLVPAQILRTGRTLVNRLLAWRPELPIFFRLLRAQHPHRENDGAMTSQIRTEGPPRGLVHPHRAGVSLPHEQCRCPSPIASLGASTSILRNGRVEAVQLDPGSRRGEPPFYFAPTRAAFQAEMVARSLAMVPIR